MAHPAHMNSKNAKAWPCLKILNRSLFFAAEASMLMSSSQRAAPVPVADNDRNGRNGSNGGNDHLDHNDHNGSNGRNDHHRRNGHIGQVERTGRIDQLFQRGLDTQDAQFLLLSIADIIVNVQIRQQFEDDCNRLQDLAASIRAHGVMQPVLVRPGEFGRYMLIAGERRLRAAKMAGLLAIPALVRNMSDAEADDMQLAENIQRKNLTQIEEAQKIQRDLNQLGSVEAVLAKHQKSKSWLSKMLGLLNLPQQARRLLSENISADTEVIAQLKTIEKADPALARATVEELKQNRGRQDARATVAAVRQRLKSKRPHRATVSGQAHALSAVHAGRLTDGPAAGLAGDAQTGLEIPLIPALQGALDLLYQQVMRQGRTPRAALTRLASGEQAQLERGLREWFLQGCDATPQQALEHLQSGHFAAHGGGALALLAYLQGMQKLPPSDLQTALASLPGRPARLRPRPAAA